MDITMKIITEAEKIEQEADGIYTRSKTYCKPYYESPYFSVWKGIFEFINDDVETVVDMGCGPGQFMDFCMTFDIFEYHGYDISGVAISMAEEIRRKKHLNKRVFLHKCNLLQMAEIADGDVYILSEILEHITNDHDILKLIPSGKQVIIALPNYMGGSHVRKFTHWQQIADRYKEISFILWKTIPMGNHREIIIGAGIKTNL